jgi:hypothetical protein
MKSGQNFDEFLRYQNFVICDIILYGCKLLFISFKSIYSKLNLDLK